MKKLAVIVPCYNEELVIAESYRRTREALQKLPVLTEIIYINDGSRDRTRLMLDEIAASDPQVKVIHFSRNFGHQPAVTAGINNCDADLAVILDADMQDPPELIPSILELQEKEQANVVYCVRKSREGEGLFKKVTAKVFYRMLNYMSDVNFPLDTGDFRLIDRKVMDQFDRFQERGKYIRGLIKRNAFFKPFRKLITVHTVDGFQGQERDVIMISLVRANDQGNIGFLNDLRRMNVAITRARMKLIILGDASTLTKHAFYRELYKYITAHGHVIQINNNI